MNRSATPPPDDFRAGLRPPQFNLRFLLFGLTACCVLLAALRWLNPAAIVGVMLIVFSIIAHVVGNALGTQLQDQGNRKLPEDLPPGLAPLGQPLDRATRRRVRPATTTTATTTATASSTTASASAAPGYDPSAAPASAVPIPESSAGETSAGETSAGETSAGETSAGETSAGEAPAGETSAGEASVADDPRAVASLSAEDDDALSGAWSDASEFAPPSKLTQRESLGRVIYIAPVVTAVALATAGGFWLRHVVGAKATMGNMAFGIAAFAVLGCILGFLLGSFVKVLVTANLDAWRNGESPP